MRLIQLGTNEIPSVKDTVLKLHEIMVSDPLLTTYIRFSILWPAKILFNPSVASPGSRPKSGLLNRDEAGSKL